MSGSATSFFDSYYPDGTHFEERDHGLTRVGRYVVKHDALCTNLREGQWSGCTRYYRAPGGETFVVAEGLGTLPWPLKIVGPAVSRMSKPAG